MNILKNIGVLHSLVYHLRGITPTEKLIQRGMRVGKNFYRGTGVLLDPGCCWLLEIGDDVGLSDHVKVYCHDASTKPHLGHTKVGMVKIGDRVFVGAGTVILPNVTIGRDVVIGAGSVVTRDIPGGMVAAGNPARVICTLEEYLGKESARMEQVHVWDEQETAEILRDRDRQEKVRELIRRDGISYIY